MVQKNNFNILLLAVLSAFFFYPGVSSAKMVVGVIFSGNIPYYRDVHVAFLDNMKKLLPAADEVKYVVQFPASDPVALSNAAKKLVVGGVNMIISYGYPATQAVMAKESDIPLVYIGVYDPESLIVRVGPVTGCGYKVPLASLLRYYKQAVEIERLNVVYNPDEEDTVRQMNELAGLSVQEKISLVRVEIKSRSDLDKLDRLGKGDAVFITGSAVAHVMIKDIMSALQVKQVPAVDIFPDSAGEGVLITLYEEPGHLGAGGAEIAAKVVGGVKVDTIEQAVQTKTELVFNLGAAKRLGVNIPNQLVSEATKVIE